MKGSISRRMLGGSALVLFGFLSLAGLSLDQAYRDSTTKALQDQLRAHLYLLLATTEEDQQGRPRLPQLLSAPGFNRPDSGLYAKVSALAEDYSWRSASLLGRDLDLNPHLPLGDTRVSIEDGLMVMQQGIGWDDLAGNSLPYVFAVALEAKPLSTQQNTFRASLWAWLGGLGLLLLMVQFVFIRWGLRPLRKIAGQVRDIESGHERQIPGPVPRELAPLTENLNSLISQTQGRQERLRNSLADLAHSLKTPLAILRGAAQDPRYQALGKQIDAQTARIDQIVSYQRQRLAVVGSSPLSPPLPVGPILRRICDGLLKIHQDRQLRCDIEVPVDFRLRADQGDLFELFGNLLENACKYGRQRVRVRVEGEALLIEDDGAGIAVREIKRLLQRGQRGDQQGPGEGIGLAVAQEIVTQYDGALEIDRSPLGGASIRLTMH